MTATAPFFDHTSAGPSVDAPYPDCEVREEALGIRDDIDAIRARLAAHKATLDGLGFGEAAYDLGGADDCIRDALSSLPDVSHVEAV